MKPAMTHMSPKLIVSALASTLAMAAFALSGPAAPGHERGGQGPLPTAAGLSASALLAN